MIAALAHIDPETTWTVCPDGLIRGAGAGFKVTTYPDGWLLMLADGRRYSDVRSDGFADAITEARDVRRLVMGN